jgi:hypothetical protein
VTERRPNRRRGWPAEMVEPGGPAVEDRAAASAVLIRTPW